MSIEWKFGPDDDNMSNWADSDKKLVSQIKSEMTYLEILERENDQNFGDARFDKTKPTISNYSIMTIKPSEKKEFMDTLNMTEALRHVDAAANPTNPEAPSSLFLDPTIGKEIPILVFNQSNGLGLLGGERKQDMTADEPKNFLGLVKSSGLNSKQDEGSGGSHGVGKNVYWHWSQYGMVLFYSSLSTPYNDCGKYSSASEGKTRFIATCRVGVSHEIDGKWYNQSGLAGNTWNDGTKDIAVSLFDDEADAIAQKLGLELRDSSDPGVTIAIVGFRNPGQGQEDEATDSVLDRLLRSAAANWFPAKISGALEVSVTDDGVTEEWDADLGRRTKLLQWLDKGEDEAAGPTALVSDPSKGPGSPHIPSKTTYKRIEVNLKIPRDYPGNPTNSVQESRAVLALQITDAEWPSHKKSPSLGVEEWGNIACIRHDGMVVTYKPFIQKPNKQYEGLLLVGSSVELFDKKLRGKTDKIYQDIGEEMMKLSEPAVHDDWVPNNFQAAANDREEEYKKIAKPGMDRIKNFLRDVEKAIRNVLGDVEPPKASEDASWDELSKALDFGKSGSDSGGRIIRITNSSFTRTNPDKGRLTFDLLVPELTDDKWTNGATKWSLKLKPTVTFADGKKQAVSHDCWDFERLLDDANHVEMASKVKMNYAYAKANWKKPTSSAAEAMKVDEWTGKINQLEATILPNKVIKITFKDLEIDLTGYENASFELTIEANEVKP